MKPHLYEICARINKLPPHKQIFELRELLKAETLNSIRWVDLQSFLVSKMTRQLKRESRAA